MSEVQATETATVEEAPIETPETETVPVEVDWKDKYEGQRKVNIDLERKFKAAADAAAKLEAAAELATKPVEEQALEAARVEARTEATNKANARILKADLRAAATGKLADPTDAALYLDLSTFSVSEDGETDSDALNDAIAELLTRKPHLAAGKPARFDGAADQGIKGKAAGLSQLTDADLEKMTPTEINEARRAGRFDKLLGAKT